LTHAAHDVVPAGDGASALQFVEQHAGPIGLLTEVFACHWGGTIRRWYECLARPAANSGKMVFRSRQVTGCHGVWGVVDPVKEIGQTCG
jgi:hypothetical protein